MTYTREEIEAVYITHTTSAFCQKSQAMILQLLFENDKLKRIGRAILDADEHGQGQAWIEAMNELNEALK